MQKVVRRVVVGNNGDGKSVFVSDGPPPRARFSKYVPGLGVTVVWNSSPGETVPGGGEDITEKNWSYTPPAGGGGIVIFDVPPAGTQPPADKAAEAGEEILQVIMPGIAQLFDEQGMHATDTIDYVIVLEGEVWSIVDTGETLLKAGDILIQNGTRHNWENRSSKPAKICGVMLGAKRV